MNCSDLWSCISMQLGIAPWYYSSGAVYLFPIVGLVLFVSWFIIEIGADVKSTQRRIRFLFGLSMALGWLLTLPALFLRINGKLALGLLGAPVEATVFQLDPSVLEAAAKIADWMALVGIVGIAICSLAFLTALFHRRTQFSKSTAPTGTLSPSAGKFRSDHLLTPKPENPSSPLVTPPQFSPGVSSRSLNDSDKTLRPSAESFGQALTTRPGVAWLELSDFPSKGVQKRWELDKPKSIGRRSATQTDPDLIELPNAPQTISRNQLRVDLASDGYYLKNNGGAGDATVKADGHRLEKGNRIKLKDGMEISVGDETKLYLLLFRQLGTPTLEISRSGDRIAFVQIRQFPYTIGKDENGPLTEYPVGRINFDIDADPEPAYVVKKAMANSPIRLTVDDGLLEDDPVPLVDGMELSLTVDGDLWQYRFFILQ